ncbi:MAG: hypothetical protein IKX20_11785 [Paludibacteraceae bacterium]|nr:hypothetical protein [Paludibacteraceae bacterium]
MKTRSSHLCDHKGLGLSQQARFGESGSDPDRNTARQVLEPSIGTLLASYRGDDGSRRKSAYSYEYALLAKY